MTLFTSLKKEYSSNVHIAKNSFTPSTMPILHHVHVGKRHCVFTNAIWHPSANNLPLKFLSPSIIFTWKTFPNFAIWVEFWIHRILMTKRLIIISRMLGHGGDEWYANGIRCRTLARFYITIVQAVLLYGSEMWVLSQRSRRHLDTFHHRCARFMANKHIRQLPSGEWITPHSDDVLEQCGLSPISTYIAKRKTRLLHNYAEPYSPSYRQCMTSAPVVNPHHRLEWWGT